MTKRKRPPTDTEVVDDPAAPSLPIGCIASSHLRALADALEALESWHQSQGGDRGDTPCLRRLESNGGSVVAHISVGPPIGGHWERLELKDHSWILFEEE